MAESRYALLSVYNKKGIETLARGLSDMGFTILSTGGTADAIQVAGLPVIRIADYISTPEMMDGRVQTLHPRIHAGIVAIEEDGDFDDLKKLHASPIDLVVVNLYPFMYATAAPDMPLTDAMEQMDLGGPALLRSAARNFQRVTAVCSPDDYETVLWHIAKNNDVPMALRCELAVKALAHTSTYDQEVMNALSLFDLETGRKKTNS